MSTKCFVDTNVWCYSFDQATPLKRAISSDILHQLARENRIVLSTQVLNEFFVVAIRSKQVNPLEARAAMQAMCMNEVTMVGPDLILRAVDLTMLISISYWDALMVAAAEHANCRYLLSEDLQHRQTIRGVQIWNPFLEPLP